MDLDDRVCLCFRVTKRKLVHFLRRELPTVPSQLSQCGGAGTGCGWCVPYLKLLFRQYSTGETEPDDTPTADEYIRLRAEYVQAGKGVPPSDSDLPSAGDTPRV